MERNRALVARTRHSAGEAAADGLLAGIAGGLAMAGVLVAAGMLNGEAPAATLARFDATGSGRAIMGLLFHLGVSAVYELIFGVMYRLLGRGRMAGPAGGALLGIAYGMLLWLVAWALSTLPAAETLRQMPELPFAAAHAEYGALLGWLVGRS